MNVTDVLEKIHPTVRNLLIASGVKLKMDNDLPPHWGAAYDAVTDTIHVPESSGADMIYLSHAMLHELCHWTGAVKRLNRPPFEIMADIFRGAPFVPAFQIPVEEITAQTACNALCQKYNIFPAVSQRFTEHYNMRWGFGNTAGRNYS